MLIVVDFSGEVFNGPSLCYGPGRCRGTEAETRAEILGTPYYVAPERL